MDATNKNGSALITRRDSFSKRVIELDCGMDKLKVNNSLLIDRVRVNALEESKYSSNVDLLVESPTSKLNKIFGFQKSSGNKCGLGFDHKASTSKGPSVNKGNEFCSIFPIFEQCSNCTTKKAMVVV